MQTPLTPHSDHPPLPVGDEPLAPNAAGEPEPTQEMPALTSEATVSLPISTVNALNALLHEQAKSQQAKRIRRYVWLGIILGLLGLLFLWPNMRGSANKNSAQKHVALIKLEGTIEYGGQAGAEAFNAALEAAFEDSASVGVILQMNSPGGSPVQAALIYEEIKRLRDKHQKPLYAVVEEVCASGCYYVAAAADEIYVNPASMVGSIGVLMDGFGASELMKKLGVERRLYIAGENKGMLDPFSPAKPQHQAIIQSMLAEVHQTFIQAVRDGRTDRLKETPDLFSGRIFTGTASIKNGLADDIGSVSSVARDVLDVDNIVDYSPRENIAERVAKKLGASFGGAFGAQAGKSLWQSRQGSQGVWQ